MLATQKFTLEVFDLDTEDDRDYFTFNTRAEALKHLDTVAEDRAVLYSPDNSIEVFSKVA